MFERRGCGLRADRRRVYFIAAHLWARALAVRSSPVRAADERWSRRTWGGLTAATRAPGEGRWAWAAPGNRMQNVRPRGLRARFRSVASGVMRESVRCPPGSCLVCRALGGWCMATTCRGPEILRSVRQARMQRDRYASRAAKRFFRARMGTPCRSRKGFAGRQLENLASEGSAITKACSRRVTRTRRS